MASTEKRYKLAAIEEFQSVREVVVDRLREAILQGRLAPGTPLRIQELAKELKVSLMPVREALHILVTEGLATRIDRRGVVVRPLSVDDVIHAYSVMGVLEGMAARYAAEHLSEVELDELRNLNQQMGALIGNGDHETILELNRTFHRVVCNAEPNQWCHEFLRQLWNFTYPVRRSHPRSSQRLTHTVEEHDAIIAALAARDGESAERLAREHNQHAADDLLQRLAEDDDR